MVTRGLVLGSLVAMGCSAAGGGSGGSVDGGAAAGGSGATSSGGAGGTGAGGTGAGVGKKIGEPCERDEECTDPPDAECFRTIGGGPVPQLTFPGGYCSKACDMEGGANECGSTGSCSSSSLGGGMTSVSLTICVKPCSRPGDCRVDEGYRCAMVIPGFGTCVP